MVLSFLIGVVFFSLYAEMRFRLHHGLLHDRRKDVIRCPKDSLGETQENRCSQLPGHGLGISGRLVLSGDHIKTVRPSRYFGLRSGIHIQPFLVNESKIF